jgi:hypothetical protein
VTPQQFRNSPASERPRPIERLDPAGLLTLWPVTVAPAPLPRGHPAAFLGPARSRPASLSSAIDDGDLTGDPDRDPDAAQGARANDSAHGARHPTRPRSSSRANPISVSPNLAADLRFLW